MDSSALASLPATPVDESALRLVRHIDKWIDGHRASGDAFVASVYGEWGIGKTYCLKAIHDSYQARLATRLRDAAASNSPIVVPVWFAPWRYEHEEHLVVPLLKTIEYTLRQAESQVPPAQTGEPATRDSGVGYQGLGAALKRGSETVGRLAQALLSAVKFKASMFGLELDIDPKEAIKLSREIAKAAAPAGGGGEALLQPPAAEDAKRIAPLSARLESAAKLESIYFDAQHELTSLTQPAGEREAIRLVVLVDDLDRCLPEKAIQVLESVKLFLNVPGFSFVLAVDDEVVERGIAHRYRDYRIADKEGGFLGDLPINGTQYLEKIVHLPLHLPRWTAEKARAFLLARYPQLFTPPREPRADGDRAGIAAKTPEKAPVGAARATAAATKPATEATAVSSAGSEALEMILAAVPLVPRKLIRLCEGVEYLQSQFGDLGATTHWSLLHALRVVALQQLHPALYRHLRQRAARYWRLFELRRDAWGEPQYSDGENLAKLKEAFNKRNGESAVNAVSTELAAEQSQALETRREKLDLLETAHHAGAQRGAGDPLALFAVKGSAPSPMQLALAQQTFSDLYFAGEAPPAPLTPAAVPAVSGTRLPESHILETDTDAAVAALLSPDAVARREFIEQKQLEGKRLPDAVMQRVLARIAPESSDEISAGTHKRTLDMAWLRDMAGVLSAEQLLMLYNTARVVERWVESLTSRTTP